MDAANRCAAFREVIEKVSRSVVKDFPDLEYDDLTQELYLAVLTHRDTIPEPSAEDDQSNLILHIAKNYARKNRTQALNLSPQYNYRQSDVRKILEESMWYYSQWTDGYTPEDDPSEYRQIDPIIARSDIAWAIDFLPSHYKNAIIGRFKEGMIPQTGTAEYSRLDRALRKLTDILNSYKRERPQDGPGTRKVITNATARFIIDKQSDD